ncbi:MAG: PBSX family phage terminase large subunit [Oscillospiraceae bacterium]|nr:PBSX family phage terminase large subunit [Oscillospiraceae bacterium]
MAWTSPRTPGINTVRSAVFQFKPFSRRQKAVLAWWTPGSPYEQYDGIIADGSIRSGKTVSMATSFLLWSMTKFDSQNFALCGKTIGSLRRNVIRDFKRIAAGRGYTVMENRGDKLITISRGARVNYYWLFGGRDESSQDLIQGITLAGVLFDEAALMPESFVNQATGRCSVDGSKYWFNCNPEGRLHWFKLNWINKFRDKHLLYLHFTMDDNLSLSERVKERYRSMYTGVFFQRYIQGLWVAAEGVIYDCWDEAANSFDISKGSPWEGRPHRRYVAVDYGTTNPTVFLDIYYDGNVSWIAREMYQDSRKDQRQYTPAQHADLMDQFLDGDHSPTIIIDPSAEAFRLELRNRGYRVTAADNEVLEGIRMTATLIAQRRIRAEKSCVNFRSEIQSYVWDQKAAEQGEERPVKERDHAADALRYYVKTTFNRATMRQK